MNKLKTYTRHAEYRLNQRSTLDPEEIVDDIVSGHSKLLAVEMGTNIRSHLLFSDVDSSFLVVVEDPSNGEIITVMPPLYWNNLQKQKDRFWNFKQVTVNDLFQAVRLKDPGHELLEHPPLAGRENAVFHMRFEHFCKWKTKYCGRLSIPELLSTPNNEAPRVLVKFMSQAFSKIGDFSYPVELIWGVSKNLHSYRDRKHVVELTDSTSFESILVALKLDFSRRVYYSRKYDDFEQVEQ